MPTSAAERWRADLASWAIPEEILAGAPEDPWHFPVELFVSRAEAADEHVSFSNERALEVLPQGGTVLDVGSGAGGGSMPLASRASLLIGVDSSDEMLQAFREQAARRGVRARTVPGRWPDVAPQTPIADVVVCHHVAYNAPDLPDFAVALTMHARRRVIMEMTAVHPQSRLNPLWLRFHGVVRPTRPIAQDAVEVLREAGLEPEFLEWNAPRPGGFRQREDIAAWVRRSLCLPMERQPEVVEAIDPWIVERDGLFGFSDLPVVTVWWNGAAPPS